MSSFFRERDGAGTITVPCGCGGPASLNQPRLDDGRRHPWSAQHDDQITFVKPAITAATLPAVEVFDLGDSAAECLVENGLLAGRTSDRRHMVAVADDSNPLRIGKGGQEAPQQLYHASCGRRLFNISWNLQYGVLLLQTALRCHVHYGPTSYGLDFCRVACCVREPYWDALGKFRLPYGDNTLLDDGLPTGSENAVHPHDDFREFTCRQRFDDPHWPGVGVHAERLHCTVQSYVNSGAVSQ